MSAKLAAANEQFYSALNAMLGGDADPMLDVWSQRDDTTYMSPFGELLVGPERIRVSWQAQAQARLGGRVDGEDMRYIESPTLGVVVGFERGSVEVEGIPTVVNIRATSIYRLEDDRWMMIGHHTDPLG